MLLLVNTSLHLGPTRPDGASLATIVCFEFVRLDSFLLASMFLSSLVSMFLKTCGFHLECARPLRSVIFFTEWCFFMTRPIPLVRIYFLKFSSSKDTVENGHCQWPLGSMTYWPGYPATTFVFIYPPLLSFGIHAL